MDIIKKGLFTIATAGALALFGCGDIPGGTGGSGGSGGTGGGTSTDKITCFPLTLEQDYGGLVSGWHDANYYGSNHIFVNEVEVCGTEYCFEDGTPVEGFVWKHDELPQQYVWAAGRPGALDGNDPKKFLEEDPFWVGYLPHTPKGHAGWSSKNTTYDWRCEDGDSGVTNNLENCIGLNQLDTSFTLNTLQPGQNYLARILLGGNPNDTKSWILFCKQGIFEYEGAE